MEKNEILEEIVDYLPRLIETAEEVCLELKGEQEEDTKELFNQVVDGINWTLGMYYEVEASFKEPVLTIQKEELENHIQEFAKAIELKEEEKIAEIMENKILSFLKELYKVAVKEIKK